MMRALRAALAALCFVLVASVATAATKGALIIKSEHSADTFGYQSSTAQTLGYVQAMLTTLGVSYDVVGESAIGPNAFQPLRRGRFLRQGESDTSSYAVVVHVGYYGGRSYGSNYDPRTLTFATNYPKVPQIFFGADRTATDWAQETGGVDSTGMGLSLAYAAGRDTTMTMYVVGDPGTRWKAPGLPLTLRGTSANAHGYRPLIGAVGNKDSGGIPADGDFDGAWNGTNPTQPDTLVMWMTMCGFPNASGALAPINGDGKPIIWATKNANSLSTTADPMLILLAFAKADSFAGGALFNTSDRLPLLFGIHIDDGWKRSWSRNGSTGGFDPSDTTTAIASIDSLASLKVPFTVGVELDSLLSGAYPRDKVWWERSAPYVSYTPHSHAGLGGSSYRSVGIARGNDLWGSSAQYRYVQAYTAGDTTVKALAVRFRQALSAIDSAFGGGGVRLDRFGMPPTDDYSNVDITAQNAGGLDSLYLAMALGGYRGTRFNPGCSNCNASTNHASSGFWVNPRVEPVRLASPAGFPDMRGVDIRLIGCAAYSSQGAAVNYINQSTGNAQQVAFGILCGAWQPTSVDVVSSFYHTPTRVLALHAGDMNANGQGGLTRPGYFLIKYFTNEYRAANAFAGRRILHAVKCEDIR